MKGDYDMQNEEKRLKTRIALHKYQSVNIDNITDKRAAKNELFVRIKDKLVPYNEAHYMSKELYRDNNIPKNIKRHEAYIDRMKQWDSVKFNECNAKLKTGRISSGCSICGQTIETIEQFLSMYNGYPCRLIAVSENTGYNGYDYTYLQWVDVNDIKEVDDNNGNPEKQL